MEAFIIRGDLHIFRFGSRAREEPRLGYFELPTRAKWTNQLGVERQMLKQIRNTIFRTREGFGVCM